MKTILLFFLIIIWMLITLCLAVSIIGVLVFITEDEDWFKLGKKLLDNFII